jgi:hypothetical protein
VQISDRAQFFTFAGWVNRHQQALIEYLQAENRALREQLGKKRIRWTDAQRRRLASSRSASDTCVTSSLSIWRVITGSGAIKS